MASRATPLDKAVGERLRDIRKESGLTQPQVASHLGIAYQSYQKMERGEHSFRLSTMVSLAELYQTTVDQLIDGLVSVDPVKAGCHYLIERFGRNQLEEAAVSLATINHKRK